ncbi:MAG: universal stress protein [Roseobacter sp.]|jgi:nucleotide-binding universal stress UspA family protein|nr:universal stress protein [Roseobacter sp.]
MFKCIVVAIDGSEPSQRALEAACTLATAFAGEVHLVHALENKLVEVPPHTASWTKESEDGTALMARATAAAQALNVTPASTTIGEGDAFEEIMTIAGLYSADLIVTGRRGLGNLHGLFAGSTSQQIAKSASCAFLSVK